jgi:crotonobetainyl-CoA:carnitine CoA-transferase CaiB-like acyl-CoA transferase
LLAIGANTPAQLVKLGDALGIGAPIRELLEGQSTGFVTASRGEEIRQLLAKAVSSQPVSELEVRLNQEGVPAAQVRDLAQSVRDATQSGAMSSWMLSGETPVAVPGLGFRAHSLFGGASEPKWNKPSTHFSNKP